MSDEAKLLKDTVVIVTGGGNGGGAEPAKLAALNGAWVVVNDLGVTEDGDSAMTGQRTQSPRRYAVRGARPSPASETSRTGIPLERSLPTPCRPLAASTEASMTPGVVRDAFFHKMDERTWDLCVEINMKGASNVSRAARRCTLDRSGDVFAWNLI